MPAAIVATMGLSPPVVTEFLQHLISRGEDVRRIVLLSTEEKEVLAGSKLVETAVRARYPKIEVITEVFPYQDVDNEERSFDFLIRTSKLISDLRGKYRLYLLISGGRKVMSLELAMMGLFFPLTDVYHVIARDVKVANILLESLREKIMELYKAGDPLSFYRSVEEFERLMWPPQTEYNVVRLPSIPYPDEVLREVVKALRGARKDEVKFNIAVLMEQLGLIQVSGGKTIPTEYGRKMLEFLREIM
jgi:CRISPR-associated protein Csx14